MKSRLFTLLNLMVCLALIVPGGVQPVMAAQPNQPAKASIPQPLVPGLADPPVLLRLRVGDFDPLRGEPDIPTGMRRTLTSEQSGLRLIQFTGPIQDEHAPFPKLNGNG